MKKEEVTKQVRTRYANVAKQSSSCGCSGKTASPQSSFCCGTPNTATAKDISKNIGYTDTDVNSVPEGANLGLGCGNPGSLSNCSNNRAPSCFRAVSNCRSKAAKSLTPSAASWLKHSKVWGK